ncbi:MAG: DNA translocase FtsK [Chloroflexi bacterium]|nr:MAG: DNA translocase FtsK [Chloroflexota bacterium]
MREELEFMADRIESVLSIHQIPARVTGGTVTPRWVRFQVLPAVGAKISKIKSLSEELAAALDAPHCRVSRRGAAVAVEVPRDDPQPVRLLPLYHQLESIPPLTAVLGLAEDGSPLLIRLPSSDVGHIFVAGMEGAGKTMLLQAITLSLAMANSPLDTLGLVLINLRGHTFDAFKELPHLARPVIRHQDEATEALASLTSFMKGRHLAEDKQCPHIVVVIDELADLLKVKGQNVTLARLTHRGCEAGIHVIAATQKLTTTVFGPLVKANFPVRLVGRVDSTSDARTAAGWSGTGAQRLQGRGDFVAVAEGRVIRFQAAYISPQEIREALAQTAQSLPSDRPIALPWPAKRLFSGDDDLEVELELQASEALALLQDDSPLGELQRVLAWRGA